MSEPEYYSGGGEKTIAKTVILDKYLGAYLAIMKKNWRDEKWYVDTHAGTGFTRELGVNIPGSALRALGHDFDRFYLYEKDPDRFETLVDTLDDNTDASLSRGEVKDTGDPMASSDDPCVRVFNMDCNEGVKWLVDKARSNVHWFTFVDPEKLTLERELIDELCARENMDILLNFQTSAFHRNARDSAGHSLEKVALNLGEDFPMEGTPDEYVEWYEQEVFGEIGWKSASRPMVSEGDNAWRYDLIFASKNGTALGIIEDIYTSDLNNDVMKEIREWREKSDADQKGIESFVHIPTGDSESDNDQADLDSF